MEPLNHGTSTISLLYVEDDPGARETISSVISAKFPSVSIRTADNGEAGLKSFQERGADIVLTDISMPVMNGIQMAIRIRALDAKVDIIAATAFSDTHYLMDAINAGIRRYVLKPVKFGLLFEALEDCIARITLERRIKLQDESIRKLSRSVEQSPSMVIIADASGAVEYVNSKFSAVSGYAPEEVIGRNLRLLMTNASPLDIFEEIWSAITGGSEWRGEIINRKKDGELYCEEIAISPLAGEEGETTHFVLVMEDVSKRKRTEDALKESEYLIGQSQSGSSIGSYKAFFNSGAWESSEVLDGILGIDKSYRRNLPGWLDLLHPDDRGAVGRYLAEKIAGRRISLNMEFNVVRKSDGEVRKVRGLGKAAYDHEGKILSMIGTIRDITESRPAGGEPKLQAEAPARTGRGRLRQAESGSKPAVGNGRQGSGPTVCGLAEHKRLEQALQESEQRFASLCDLALIGIFWTDWEGNNIYSNPMWERITGQSAAQAKGKGWLSAVHPEDGERLGEAWLKAIVGGGRYSLEHRMITAQGETVWVRSRASNLKGADGQVLGFVGTLESIDEAGQAKRRSSNTKV